jgi:hypothetical protein
MGYVSRELIDPPPGRSLHVFTFALSRGSVRTVLVQPVVRGGDA